MSDIKRSGPGSKSGGRRRTPSRPAAETPRGRAKPAERETRSDEDRDREPEARHEDDEEGPMDNELRDDNRDSASRDTRDDRGRAAPRREPVYAGDERDDDRDARYREEEERDNRGNRGGRDTGPDQERRTGRGAQRDAQMERDDRDEDRDRDRDRARDDRGRNDARPEPRAEAPAPKATDEYAFHAYYDKAARTWVGSVLEFPEIKVQAGSRDGAMRECEKRLDTHLQGLKRGGNAAPEAFYAKQPPEKIEIKVSPSLYRRLELMARHEKVNLEFLVTELLSGAAERKIELTAPQPQSNASAGHGGGQNSGGGRGRHHQGGNRDRGHHRGGNQGGRGRNTTEMMDNRENFMEYVRNLEKSGGGAGGYRKK